MILRVLGVLLTGLVRQHVQSFEMDHGWAVEHAKIQKVAQILLDRVWLAALVL